MRRCRPLLSLLLGLLFLVQGLAVAAAPLPTAALDAPAAMQDAMPPCHADAAAAASPSDPAPCCHADCPDMTHCALSQLLTAPEFALALIGPVSAPAALPPPQASSHPSGSPLRPPIHLPV